jgi:hypothetical protein
MGVIQTIETRGQHVVLVENLYDRAGLLARELPVHLSHQEFVAEFGHGEPLSPSG